MPYFPGVVLKDIYDGDLLVADNDVVCNGIIRGCVHVTNGKSFVLNGMVVGDVNVDSDGHATINGMVMGRVTGGGKIAILGQILDKAK